MHPENVALLKVAAINCCVLSNNHVIDFGFRGLLETLETLNRAGIKTAGAGETSSKAASPAILENRVRRQGGRFSLRNAMRRRP